jgi:hypothetical protein
MSKENLLKLMQAAAKDDQLLQQIQNSANFDEVKTLAEGLGLHLGDLTVAEAQRTVDAATGNADGELTDEEMEMVAGGLNFEEIKVTFKFDRKRPGQNFEEIKVT